MIGKKIENTFVKRQRKKKNENIEFGLNEFLGILHVSTIGVEWAITHDL